ncbi:SCO7613 C-terminal domain-containing membrane protein [Pilimelia columellifera]|uniref:DUF2157 domain-containing protein n=1 Tax=Pilimelia columellifera subsp. columellifera TaxID=706583 RepID=A0ABN3N7Z2_9ACTN
MTYPCPFCGAPASLAAGCPRCGRGPDPEAAEAIAIDAALPGLRNALSTAAAAHEAAQIRLAEAEQRRSVLAAAVAAREWQARSAATTSVAPTTPVAMPMDGGVTLPPVDVVGGPGAGRRQVAGRPAPEVSSGAVQTVLFILGGLLLGAAAIVFTAVAWARYGVGVRAAILAIVTALVLSIPPLARRRRLTATAETFAAVGLLLVALDGYAAWHANVGGVADRISGSWYAAGVCAVTAGAGAGYAALTGLTGPRIAALVAAQPVAVLVAAAVDPGPAGWATAFALTALGDAAVATWRRGAVAVVARIGHGVATVLGLMAVTGALVTVSGPGSAARTAGAAWLVAAAVLAGGYCARTPALRTAADAAALIIATVGAARLADRCWPGHGLVVATGAAALAAVVALAARTLPARPRFGIWLGAAVGVGVLTVVATSGGFAAGVWSIGQTWAEATPREHWRWQPLVAVALLTVAAVLLAAPPDRSRARARRLRLDALVWLAAVAVLVAGWAAPLPAWALPLLDAGAAVGALFAAVTAGAGYAVLVRTAPATALIVFALAAGFGRAWTTSVVAGALTVAGIAVAATARDRGRAGAAVAGLALAAGLLAAPGAVAAALAAARVEPWWTGRAVVGAAVLAIVGARVLCRHWTVYQPHLRTAALIIATLLPLAGVAETGPDAPAVYSGLGVLMVAAVVVAFAVWPVLAAPSAVVSALAWLATVASALVTTVLLPYGWLTEIWAGRPTGVGLSPSATGAVWVGQAVAVALLAAAVAVVVAGAGRGRAAAAWAAVPIVVVAVPMALAAAGAWWPAVPTACLALGLAAMLAAVRCQIGERAVPAVAVGMALTGAGLAGSLPVKAATIGALALLLVAAAVAATFGRRLGARVAAALVAGVAGLLLAFTAARAADADSRVAALAVLGAAAVALAVAAVLRGRRRAESAAAEVVAHSGAVVALLLTAGHPRHAALVATLWAAALGLRGLTPGETPVRRRGYVAAGLGAALLAWWLLLASHNVAVMEAYTVPLAAVALLLGWLATRRDPSHRSWSAYGPGLAAGLLPTLGSVLVGDGQPWRRLALGAAALVAVLLGSVYRRQAPVVLGGIVLALTALHELVLVWDDLPRWIPLAVGGLLLVGLAVTLERRRRDLAALRAAIRQMT